MRIAWPVLCPPLCLILCLALAGCETSPSPASDAAPSAADAPSRNGHAVEDATPGEPQVPPCWTVTPERGASAAWNRFAPVDRLDPSLRATVHAELMHLCWAEEGRCPADRVLLDFLDGAFDDLFGTAIAEVPWAQRGSASLRMGPMTAHARGITVDAAAFVHAETETVVARRYALDLFGEWTVEDGTEAREEAAYALSHPGRLLVEVNLAWPGDGTGRDAVRQRMLPALTRGLFIGQVRREVRITPMDSAHWAWEATEDVYGCGASGGRRNHVGHLFDPGDPSNTPTALGPAPTPLPSRWDTPRAQAAMAVMRDRIRRFYLDNAEGDCGSPADLEWAERSDLGASLALCARPGPGGTVLPTLFIQGDPPGTLRSNGHCSPRFHLDLSEADHAAMRP